MVKEDRLISEKPDISNNHMIDILQALMFNVEEALLEVGAEPGEDYTYKDLMGYAIQLFDSDEYEILRME